MMIRYALGAALALAATSAPAEERDYCPSRPGLGTTPCTISPGRVSVETALADWTLDDQPDERTDTVLFGDTIARIGVTDTIELQLGWTPYGHVRTRDKASGMVDKAGRVGDVLFGFKANLLHPDGKGLSIAVQPFATAPVGRSPVGAGDWGAGVVLPVTYDLSETVNFQTTTEFDAAVNESGQGRHFAVSEVVGLGVKLGEQVTAGFEVQAIRDEDPEGRTTQALASVSLAWLATKDLQFDVDAVAGLNRDAPDVELFGGISYRF